MRETIFTNEKLNCFWDEEHTCVVRHLADSIQSKSIFTIWVLTILSRDTPDQKHEQLLLPSPVWRIPIGGAKLALG